MGASAAQLEIGYVAPARGESLDMRFARFLRDQPEALKAIVEIARELKAAGETRISMKLCFEVARFRYLISRVPGQRFALNNSYTSRMTRTVEATYADLAGMFETREMNT